MPTTKTITGGAKTRYSTDAAGAEAHTGLKHIEITLERFELGVDPEVSVRAWPQIQADIDRLVSLHHHVVDYAAAGELASALIGELQAAYLRLPQQRREVLLGLIDAHRVAMRTAKDLWWLWTARDGGPCCAAVRRGAGRRGVAGICCGRAGLRHGMPRCWHSAQVLLAA